MPSVVVNVVKYERANYSTLGDLLTTITTSHQHIIMMEIVIPRELQHYPVTSRPRRACCVMAVTAQLWRISTIKEDKWNEKKKKKKRVRRREIWRKDERGVRTIAPYSTLAVDVKHPSRSQWKAQQIRRWPVCIHYQSAHAPAPALNIRLPLMSA